MNESVRKLMQFGGEYEWHKEQDRDANCKGWVCVMCIHIVKQNNALAVFKKALLPRQSQGAKMFSQERLDLLCFMRSCLNDGGEP